MFWICYMHYAKSSLAQTDLACSLKLYGNYLVDNEIYRNRETKQPSLA